MARKSRAIVWRAISAMAPASSTPVGPPPITTKVRRARRSAPSSRALRRLEGEQDAAADLERVLQRLESRGEPLPLVVAEVRVARAGGEDEGVVGEGALVEDDAPAREVHRPDLREEDAHARGVAQDGAQRHRDVGGGERGRRDLVEERLEEVMVAAVHEGHANVAARERAARR